MKKWLVIPIFLILLLGGMALLSFLRAGHIERLSQWEYENKALRDAFLAYRYEYGRFPLLRDVPEAFGMRKDALAVLQADSNVPASGRENPKGIVFLGKDVSLCDREGNLYHVLVGSEMEGKLKVGDAVVDDFLAVWSYGKNGTNEFGDGDDICSWR